MIRIMHEENAYICRLLFVICLYMIETSEAIIVTQIQLSSLSYSVLTFELTTKKNRIGASGLLLDIERQLFHWVTGRLNARIIDFCFTFPLIRPQTCILLTL